MLKRFLLFFGILLNLNFISQAQEIFCNVIIDYSNVQVTAADKTIIDNNLKPAIVNFINNRKWTNDPFNPEERIKSNLYITIKGIPAQGSFEATASIQASRPVYQSSYESTLLNFFDKKFNFDYTPSLQMDFNENNYFNNLTSMLGFYAYIILGSDYDSFSKLGGNPYFEKARNVSNVAMSSGAQDAWNPGETTNRFYLIDNINNQQFLPYREGFYTYHRIALDQFTKDPEKARKEIFEVLKKLKQVQQYNPASILLRSYFLAKLNELVNIFKEADSDLKNQVVELLSQLDPVNAEKYSTRILNR